MDSDSVFSIHNQHIIIGTICQKINDSYFFCSGTVLDLPYRFIADGDHVEMERNENFEFKDFLTAAVGVAAVAADIAGAAGALDECCTIL